MLPDYSSTKKFCCVAVKHNTPCGISLGNTLVEAFEKTYACDSISIFGGIVACNAIVDGKTAKKLSDIFLEIVVAPDFSDDALEILEAKKGLRIIKASLPPRDRQECIAVDGGLLVQKRDNVLLEKWDVVTKAQPAKADIPDMIFGMRAVTFVKSNAIVIVKNEAAVGIGGGQTNRIWALEHAVNHAEKLRLASADATPARVLASDAFFPFADCVEAAAAAGIKTIVQPGGSLNDKLSIEMCDKLGLSMVFTGTRHFKH
jgi:phosphoribosylaminoimidazolecarboxamide formyltransferase/IMP cyclohydrolase